MKSFPCVAIVGVGLIGGSVGLALRRRDLAQNVVGFGSRPASLETARRLGAISAVASSAAILGLALRAYAGRNLVERLIRMPYGIT